MPANRHGKRGRKPGADAVDKRPRTANPRLLGGDGLPARSVIDRAKRLAQIRKLLAYKTRGEIVDLMCEEHQLSRRAIEIDIAEIVRDWLAEDAVTAAEDKAIAIREWALRVEECRSAGEQVAANGALRNKHLVKGVFAPSKVEISGGIDLNVGIQIEHFVDALDDDGLRAFQLVRAQIAAARTAGRLPPDPAPLVIDAIAKEAGES